MIEAPRHRRKAVLQPLAQNLLEILDPRPAVEADHVDVDAVAAFEIGGREQMRHQRFGIDAVRARHDDQARRILVIGFVAQVFDQWQLLRAHLVGDLLQYLGRRHLMRAGW